MNGRDRRFEVLAAVFNEVVVFQATARLIGDPIPPRRDHGRFLNQAPAARKGGSVRASFEAARW